MRALALLLGIAAIASTTTANAADTTTAHRGVSGIVERGGFVFGIDNVFGFAVDSAGRETRTHFGLGPGTLTPRLSFHGVTSTGVTIGGVLTIWNVRFENHSYGDVVTVGPRLGYLFMSQRGLGLWPRVGATATFATPLFEQDVIVTLSADVQFVVALTEHAALTLGPMVERPIGDHQYGTAGLTTGLLGVF